MRKAVGGPSVPSSADLPGELLTVDDAAQRIGMSVRYIRRLIAERRIPFYRLGRAVRVDPVDLATHVRDGRVEPITVSSVWYGMRSAA
mgnify:CR=1 FL=1